MRWRLALVAEILRRADDAAAEERRPLTVHRHASDQWGRRIDQPTGKREPIVRLVLGQRREKRENFRLHSFLRLEELATVMDVSRARIGGGPLLHYERRREFGKRFAKLV